MSAIPPTLAIAIVTAVKDAGGTPADVQDLRAVWQRVIRRNGERADLIHREAREGRQRLEEHEQLRAEGKRR